MGAAVSECVSKRKKQLFIQPIRIDREDEEVDRRKLPLAGSKTSKTTTQSKQPKTPMELLFPNLNENVTPMEMTHTSISSSQPSKKREGLGDISASIDNSRNIQEQKPLIKGNSQRSLNRPPELKRISKIDGASWSPIKDEYEMQEAITSIPAINARPYFDGAPE